MLLNLTTAWNHSTEATEPDNGVTLTLTSTETSVQQDPSIAIPSSDVNMGLDVQGERPEMDDIYDEATSDEDQDMSDGGAALTTTHSHAEQLNTEMDLIDVEVMGAENVGLVIDHHNHADMMEEGQLELDYYSSISNADDEATYDSYVYGEDPLVHTPIPQPPEISSLPVAMSAVSQQLQHIQDGQQHANNDNAANTQHGDFQDNSTSPFLLHPFLPVNGGNAAQFSQFEYVALADISPPPQSNTAPGLLPATHLWGTQDWMQSMLMSTQGHLDSAAHLPSLNLNTSEDDPLSEADDDEPVEHHSNLGLDDFLTNWYRSSARVEDAKKRPRGPKLHAISDQRDMKVPGPMTRKDLQGERCDIQRIDWEALGVSRLEARQMRRKTYRNYSNLRFPLQWHPRLHVSRLSDDQDFFRFRKMNFDHHAHLTHFQLRNLLSCASRDHIFYANRAYVHSYNPSSPAHSSIAMDLSNPIVQPIHAFQNPNGVVGVQISTIAIGEDILVAGGHSGEYGLINLRAAKETKHTEGIITHNPNGITNHIQVYNTRNSTSPVAAFASNDMSLRVLDIFTNKFISEFKYQHPINCTALSPDRRLRAMVGDSRNVLICNADTGEILQELEGHRDFGFACDWADDGWTVATGNQDMQVKIWDARKWTSSGIACPVATIAAEMAGVRKLKFSPIGSGKRVLVAAEPADFVNVIDADAFTSKQTLSFFGEVVGVDFTNDGQDLIVANCDSMRGGIMEFERCNFAAEATYGVDEDEYYAVRGHRNRRERNYDWKGSNEEIIHHPKSRGTEMQRTRRGAMLGTNMGVF